MALEARIHDLWTSTPQGAIQAAKLYDATAGRCTVDGTEYTTLSFTVAQRLSATVSVAADGLVPRIDSRMPNPVSGDTEVVTRFSDWRDVAGMKFPMPRPTPTRPRRPARRRRRCRRRPTPTT